MTAPLIEYLDRQMALVDSIVNACAARKANRINKLSERARKGSETKRANFREIDRFRAPAFGTALSSASPIQPAPQSGPSGLQSTGADDWDQCPACNFILVACDCDVSNGREQ